MTNPEARRPGVGDPMPDIAMEATDGGSIRPSDLKGKPAVIWFYPKDNTPGCTVEAKDFSALAPDFAKAGVALLGVSKDSPQKHRNFIDKQGLSVPLATDTQCWLPTYFASTCSSSVTSGPIT